MPGSRTRAGGARGRCRSLGHHSFGLDRKEHSVSNWTRLGALLVAGLAVTLALAPNPRVRAQAPATPQSPPAPYTLKGDLGEIQGKGFIRFLYHGEPDYLPRAGDPHAEERSLAEELASRLGLRAVFVSVAEQEDLVGELVDGRGDVIIGSLAITAERAKRVAFSRPIRFVDQLVIVKASDTSVQELGDLAGRDVTVREGSSYAEAIRGAKVKGIRIKPAPETMQTIDLLQRVERGQEEITVADSDIFEGAR